VKGGTVRRAGTRSDSRRGLQQAFVRIRNDRSEESSKSKD
jgi:hypothetical protein